MTQAARGGPPRVPRNDITQSNEDLLVMFASGMPVDQEVITPPADHAPGVDDRIDPFTL